MAPSNSDEVYDVERILAESVEDGITKYLVKWQNYPDDQCTWEPVENFDTSETLAIWNKQKALGDILEKDDLQRIQRQMDAFQATLATDEGENEDEDGETNSTTSEGQSEIGFRDLQPPRKRLRMVHDPPPLSNRARNTNKPARSDGSRHNPVNSTNSPSTQPSTRPSIDRSKISSNKVSRAKNSATIRSPAEPLQDKPTTEILPREIEHTTTARLRQDSAINGFPTTFHAPDLNSRKSREDSASKSRRHLTDRPFKTLQHLNNAKKKQVDKYYFGLTPNTPSANSTIRKDNDQTDQIAQPPDSVPNESWLFFSDDDADGQEVEMGRRSKDGDKHRDVQPADVRVHKETNEQARIKIEASAESAFAPELQPELEHISRLPVPEDKNIDIEDRMEIDQPAPSVRSVWRLERSDGAGFTGPLPLTNAPSDRTVSEDLVIPTSENTDRTSSVPVHNTATSTTNDNRALGAQHEDILGHGLRNQPKSHTIRPIAKANLNVIKTLAESDKGPPLLSLNTHLSSWQPQSDQAPTPAHVGRTNIAPGDVVRVITGRQWVKGDLVVELYLTNNLAGGVKIQHLPWDKVAPIVRLKPKHEHNLPLYFDKIITYDQYQSMTAASGWWTIFAVGAVESFPDSDYSVSSAADYLETNDLAAYWMHPDERINLMLLLYSYRSSAWQHFQPPQSTRGGETRIQIVCRNKFYISRSETLYDQPVLATPGMNNVNTRFPGQYSRRSSLASISSQHTHGDVAKSPSELLAREMADYNLQGSGHRSGDLPERIDRIPMTGSVSECSAESRKTLTSAVAAEQGRLRTASKELPPADAKGGSHMDDNQVALSTMEFSDPTTSEVHTPSTPTHQRITSGYLDRSIKQLSQLPAVISSRVDRNDIRILLVYHPDNASMASSVRERLLAQVPSPEHVWIEPTEAGLNEDDHKIWVTFKSYLRTSACVLMFDSPGLVTKMDGLAKLLEQDNITCWQVDFRVDPHKTTCVFPAGIAIALTHMCFLFEPSSVVYLLQWLKNKAEKPYSASRLILPPNITTVIQEQALLSTRPEIKRYFLKLITLIQELIMLSETQGKDTFDLGFRVLLPRWEEAYPRIDPVEGQMNAVEQNKRDQSMSDSFSRYFGAWAILKLTRHRRFMGFLTTTKPPGLEHVRWTDCKAWVTQHAALAKRKVEHRSRSRSRGARPSEANSPAGTVGDSSKRS